MAGCCFVLSLIVLAVVPCLFLPLAVFAVPTYPEQLQGLVFQGLVIGFTFVQILAAAGPIATGLVNAALDIPQLLARAVDAMQATLGDNLTELLKAVLGGNPSQMVLSGAISVVTGLVGQAIKTAAKIIDVKVLIPSFMKDLTLLGPILGIALFLAYITSIFPILMLGFPYKCGIVTGGTTGLMVGLFVLSLMANKIALIFLLLVQVILNFAFQTVLAGLIPTETLDSGLKVLLGSHAPNMTALKTSLIGLCYLNLTSPPKPKSKKRRLSEVVVEAAGHVGPQLKRLRSNPREAARAAAGATVEAGRSAGRSAVSGTRSSCRGLRSALEVAGGSLIAALMLLRTLPLMAVKTVRYSVCGLLGAIRRIPAAALFLCRRVWGAARACLTCCMCCFGMCSEYLIAAAVAAALAHYLYRNGYVEALQASMAPLIGVANKALESVKVAAEAVR
mmetsp:Transcript_47990/g.148249  ORF Transcript_47990/g.148249 Transcript_47990/m.148249 type:complete len:448 (+) Transcript_47990:91-1434(+)